MILQLLKNKDDFEEYKEIYINHQDSIDTPEKYPCFIRQIVKDWDRQSTKCIIWYKEDIEEMLNDMELK